MMTTFVYQILRVCRGGNPGLFLLLGMFFIWNCEKDTTAVDSGIFSIHDFPNRSGYRFTYQRTHRNHIIDTVEVRGADPVTLTDGRDARRWVFIKHDRTDTAYTYVEQNRLYFDYSYSIARVPIVIEFPLKIDKWWITHPFWPDTFRVVSVETIEISAGIFPNAYKINRFRSPGFNDGENSYFWIVPGIGFVKMELKGYLLNEDWELIDYHLPEQ